MRNKVLQFKPKRDKIRVLGEGMVFNYQDRDWIIVCNDGSWFALDLAFFDESCETPEELECVRGGNFVGQFEFID